MCKQVVIIEDSRECLDDIERAISSAPGFRCSGCFQSAEQAIQEMEDAIADIYLVDIHLPGMSGTEFIKSTKLRYPAADFVVYTISESGSDLFEALAVGAVGYILKGCDERELIEGLKVIAAGGGLISPRMARRLAYHFQNIGSQRTALTKTETLVLQQLRTGSTYNQIAKENHVCLSTIQTHVRKIYLKLNVNNRDDAVRTGVIFGLLD